MIIAGAGGHALEVIDLLIALGKKDITVYGEKFPSNFIRETYPVFSTLDEISIRILADPFFCLGIGNPVNRHKLYSLFTSSGAAFFPLRGASSRISTFAELPKADVMEFCYISSQTRIGQGSLINAGAQIHHEVKIGEFAVINPAAVLLGGCQIGDFCSIGSNATILPGIKIGNRVTIGAGAVIIRDVPDGLTVVGVPGLPIGESSS